MKKQQHIVYIAQKTLDHKQTEYKEHYLYHLLFIK
jgi:hypothetical protein